TDLLSSILAAISKRINHQSFNTWFKPISFATKDDSTIYLRVPNEIFRDWITNNYFDILEESLQELSLDGCKLNFLIEDSKVSNNGHHVEAAVKPQRIIPFHPQEINS